MPWFANRRGGLARARRLAATLVLAAGTGCGRREALPAPPVEPGAATNGADVAAMDMPVTDLRVPLQLYENGAVRMQLQAGGARPLPEGDAEAENAVMEFYEPDGRLTAVMQTERCRFNRRRGTVNSSAGVRMETTNMRITGVGLRWKSQEERVVITQAVRVVFFNRNGSLFGEGSWLP